MDPTDFIPWPVQLGVAGGSVSLLISTYIWLIRQFVKGTFQTKEQADERALRQKESHDATLVAIHAAHALALEAERKSAESRITDQKTRGDEWKETSLLERTGRLEQTALVKELVEAIPKLDDYLLANPPIPGGTGKAEEAA